MSEDHQQFADDDALTQSLRQWGQAQQATDEQLARMQRAIALTAANERASESPVSISKRKLHGAWGALGLVAALLFVFALSLPSGPRQQRDSTTSIPDRVQRRLPDPPKRGHEPDARTPASFAAIDERQVQQKRALVAELNSVFPQQWQWIAESPSEMRMEVGRQMTVVGDAVAVRIIVAQRSAGEQQWKTVWSVDCLARREEVVRLQANADGFHGTIVLWTYPLGDNLVAIDSDLELHDARLRGRDLRASFHGAQQERVPQQISQVESDHTEYQIFQTVANIREAAL